MTSQNIALWALINTQSKGGYSNRKKGRYRKLITITFDWIGIFWWGFQQNNSLKAFYQHPENQEYFKFLYICPLKTLWRFTYFHIFDHRLPWSKKSGIWQAHWLDPVCETIQMLSLWNIIKISLVIQEFSPFLLLQF